MRRIVLITAVLTLAVMPVLGYDFGLILDNSTTLNLDEGDTDWDQVGRAKIWFLEDTSETWSFSFEGSYVYADDRPYLFDVDELNFAFSTPGALGPDSLLSVSLGRYLFSDVSGWVFGQTADGLSVGLAIPVVSVTLSGAYTGLQLKPKSGIIMSRLDTIEDADDDIILAPPRLVGLLDVTFPELFARQDLSLAVILQQDLREAVGRDDDLIEKGTPAPAAGGGLFNSQYWGLAVSGPIVAGVYHDLFFYLQTGESLSEISGEYSYEPVLAYLGGAGLRYYRPDLRNLRIALDMLYASGDDDVATLPEGNTGGNAETFTPISKRKPALVFVPRMQNLVYVQLSPSFKPLEFLQAELRVTMFLRPTDGAIDESGLDPASDDPYLGTEVDLILNARPVSDLGITLSGGLFLPSTGQAFTEDYGDYKGLLRFELSFGL
jgi:hypothetical protein